MKILFALLAALSIAASAVGQEKSEIICGLASYALCTQIDKTHARICVSVEAKCEGGVNKTYTSRSAVVDITGPVEVGARLMQMMAAEVEEQMKADGGNVSAEDVIAHMKVVELAPESPTPSPSPSPAGE